MRAFPLSSVSDRYAELLARRAAALGAIWLH
jgi:hypothetical protein